MLLRDAGLDTEVETDSVPIPRPATPVRVEVLGLTETLRLSCRLRKLSAHFQRIPLQRCFRGGAFARGIFKLRLARRRRGYCRRRGARAPWGRVLDRASSSYDRDFLRG